MRTIQTFRHGRESEPVLVVDDFLEDPEQLIDDADMLGFGPIGEHYPGVRAAAPAHLVDRMTTTLGNAIRDLFAPEDPLDRFEAYYSMATTAPDSLRPIQRLPHFDGVEPGRLALLVFLSRDGRGGTAFYRHRSTGFETVNGARLESYRASLSRDIDRHGLPPAAYIDGDTPLFERIARYDGRFNRALVYRGNTLHCADIPEDMALTPDPRTGRLTVNVFLLTGGAS